jgi:Domain of unknown function (DUF4389)
MISDKRKTEKRETLLRIPIAIISGAILEVWGFFIFCFAIAQFALMLAEGKKNKEILKMCKVYLMQLYCFVKYITFISDDRPFPFGDLKKSVEEKK